MTDADGPGHVLTVGASGRFPGVYYPHWEWSRFEMEVAGRWRRRLVLCQLMSDAVPWPAEILRTADAGRGYFAKFAVTVDADVVERGSFGHRGTLRWRLAVRRWVHVQPLP
ncbi:hypothetical protein [Micromonospora sp. IBHARD004]|uniref:hypothetical protein n=1 Tax=Micromonospora sp. IBHARD004 TaxID=3457764 RepID=UPI00405A18B8